MFLSVKTNFKYLPCSVEEELVAVVAIVGVLVVVVKLFPEQFK